MDQFTNNEPFDVYCDDPSTHLGLTLNRKYRVLEVYISPFTPVIRYRIVTDHAEEFFVKEKRFSIANGRIR